MIKVAYFHNECAPYRVPIFEGIAKLPDVYLKVYFGRLRSQERRWQVKLDINFDYEILKEVKFLSRLFSLNPDDDPNTLNLSLLGKLLRNKYNVFIGGCPHYFGTLFTFLASKICRKPFILFLEEVDFEGSEISLYLAHFRRHPWKIFKLPFIISRLIFMQFILRNSTCYIVPGNATKNYLMRRGVPEEKIFIAWNAVDNDTIKQECIESLEKGNNKKLRTRLGIKNKKIILSVAYLLERKGLQHLIQACAKLKKEYSNFVLVIVGDGPYKQELKKLSRQKDVETIFAGYVSNLVDYYLAADVFVLPTLMDVWGFVINEAMVCGCPIITTYNAGASWDLVKNGINGYVVKAGDVEQLCQSIKKVLCYSKLREKMREASRTIIRDISFEKSLEGYRAAIDYVFKRCEQRST